MHKVPCNGPKTFRLRQLGGDVIFKQACGWAAPIRLCTFGDRLLFVLRPCRGPCLHEIESLISSVAQALAGGGGQAAQAALRAAEEISQLCGALEAEAEAAAQGLAAAAGLAAKRQRAGQWAVTEDDADAEGVCSRPSLCAVSNPRSSLQCSRPMWVQE